MGVFFGPKVKLYVEGQRKIGQTLAEIKVWKQKNQGREIVWFHCASLGEFEQGRPVLEAYKMQYPLSGILLTFFSPSGYEIRKNYALADFVTYLPIDSKAATNSFVEIVKPKTAIFVKYEFWPNIIKALKANGTKLIGISVILRPEQAFFKYWGGYFRKVLFSFDHLFVQNERTADLLRKVHFQNFTVAGDTRFDRVLDNAAKIKSIPDISDFINGQHTFVVGSAWAQDMEVLIPFVLQNPNLKFIIAPHELHAEEIDAWVQKLRAIKYSDYTGKALPSAQVLIIDSIGLLSSLYQFADFAFVGGSFGKGLHNVLEAAVFGVPIFFGDKAYHKFQEAVDLIQLEVAFAVDNTQSLEVLYEQLDKNRLLEIKIASENYIKSQSGATEAILKYLGNS